MAKVDAYTTKEDERIFSCLCAQVALEYIDRPFPARGLGFQLYKSIYVYIYIYIDVTN